MGCGRYRGSCRWLGAIRAQSGHEPGAKVARMTDLRAQVAPIEIGDGGHYVPVSRGVIRRSAGGVTTGAVPQSETASVTAAASTHTSTRKTASSAIVTSNTRVSRRPFFTYVSQPA